MDFEEFTENMLKEIQKKAGGRFDIRKEDTVKNNGLKLTGITATPEGKNIGVCVYLDESYRVYESGMMRFDEIVDKVSGLVLKDKDDDVPDFDVSGFIRWETARGSIYAKLINTEQNKGQLKEIPNRRFLDLAVVYYFIARNHSQGEIGTILIRNGHMEQWGQDEESLYRAAMGNMRADGEADFVSMETAIKDMMPGITFPDGCFKAPCGMGMYVLTNRRKRFGAAEILDKDTLRMVADQIGDGFVVLPSSVHETIILPPRDEAGYKELAEMVRDVNDTQVDIDERLSYHVYVYNKNREVLQIVA